MKIVRTFHQFDNASVPIIDIVNVDLNWSGLATLSGPSGSGKTTLFRLLSAWYESPRSICVFDPPIDQYRQVRFVGAHDSLLPWKSVAGNFQYRGISREAATGIVGQLGLSEEVLKLYIYELSYGMYKRIELAIAVHDRPKLLLLDEFFTSIDDMTKQSIRDYLQRERPDARTWITAHEAELRHWLTSIHFSLAVDKSTRCVTGIIPSE